MKSFPLYDMLYSQIKKEKITQTKKKKIIENINNLDSNAKELVYTLIQYYWKNEDKQVIFTYTPYDCIKNERTFTWNIDNLPEKLQLIIYKFTTMHIKKMKKDKSIQL